MFGNKNVFVTLTYRPADLPKDGTLDYRHFQLFMKKLRKKMVPKCPFTVGSPERDEWLEKNEIRFYMCGEYGDENWRPHYHAILFNCEFPDKVYWRKTATGYPQFRSKILEDLWGLGNCEFGSVTFKSAAYVARYIMKKVNGDEAAFHYCDVDPDTGEILSEITPEFSRMSRRPGIGSRWLKRFMPDVYPHGYVVVDGRKVRPPRFYDQLFKSVDPVGYEILSLIVILKCGSILTIW